MSALRQKQEVAQAVESYLIENPLMTQKQLCEAIGVNRKTGISVYLRCWDTTLPKLRREVFQKHWQRKPETDA